MIPANRNYRSPQNGPSLFKFTPPSVDPIISVYDDAVAWGIRGCRSNARSSIGGAMADTAASEFSAGRVAKRRPHNANDRRAAVATSDARTRTKAELSQYRVRSWAKVAPLLFGCATAVVLWAGWINREDNGLTPESGVGYWLGIVGSSLMLLLLLYPLRKRMKWFRALGTVALWFRAHMILGIFGPVLILFHANFRLGSINSNVALAAMLVVAVSGVVGRYFYSQIHLGLYGRKAEVQEILADADALKRAIGAGLPVSDRVVEQLSAFAQLGTVAPKSLLSGLLLLPVVSLRASIVRKRLISDVRQVITVEGKRLGWSRKVRRWRLTGVTELVTLHIAAVRKAAAFAFYERLFRLWHVFHLPLFFLLVIAAIIHIFAAHFF
jgi:hypothetical protein